MERLAQTDMKDWHESSLPDSDGEGYFITPLPVFLFQMVDQNVRYFNATSLEDTSYVLS